MPASAVELEQDFTLVLRDWCGAAREGTNSVLRTLLATEIDTSQNIDWDGFVRNLVGGVIWCGAAFTAVIAGHVTLGASQGFVVGLDGMVLQATSTIPRSGGTGVERRVEALERVMTYLIEATERDLLDQVRPLVQNYLNAMPNASRDTIVTQLIEKSFNQPEFLVDGAGSLPHLNVTAVQVCYAQKAADICKKYQPQWENQRQMWDELNNYLSTLCAYPGKADQARDAFYLSAIKSVSLIVLRYATIWQDWGITREHFEQLVTEAEAEAGG